MSTNINARAIYFGFTAHPPLVVYGEHDWPTRSYWYVPNMFDPAIDERPHFRAHAETGAGIANTR
jgi:hypothetical protein